MKKPLFAAAQAGFQAFFSTLQARQPGNPLGRGVGDLRSHEVPSRHLRTGKREVVVYLPPSYWHSTERYPVLYMHDGQNLFDPATGFLGKEWYVDEKLEFLIEKKLIEEIIVVGIYHGGEAREEEFTWKGQGKRYARFLVKELKPFIDRTYRTKPDREHTAVLGSSLGGVISFHLALHYPKVFSKVGLMSPALDRDPLPEAKKLPPVDLWLDMGTEEGLVEQTQALEGALSRLGDRLRSFIHEGAGHNEEAWATRVHAPLIHFFGRQNEQEKSGLIRELMQIEHWASL